jgi:dsRNA-specific ribonuclease
VQNITGKDNNNLMNNNILKILFEKYPNKNNSKL